MRKILIPILGILSTTPTTAQTPCSTLWEDVQIRTNLVETRTDVLRNSKKPTSAELNAIETAEANLITSEIAFNAAGCVVNTPTQIGDLVQASNFHYEGYFNILGLAYGGSAVSYYPQNNSLILASGGSAIGEITIPPSGETAVDVQWSATPIPSNSVGHPDTRIGGTLVFNNELWFTKYIFYDADNIQTESHFTHSLNLITGDSTGPVRVGPLKAGFYSGYMAHVPLSHQTALGGPVLTGNCCIPIITRTSFGPAAFAFNPATANQQNAIPLVYYPEDHPTLGPYNGASQYYGGSDTITGLAIPSGFGSVLFFGQHGTTFCYGTGPNCNDPIDPYQGTHGYPYNQSVWAYKVSDLSDVRQGLKQPWEITPYAIWTLPEVAGKIIGATIDLNNKIYISQYKGSGDNPRIYVYQIQ